MLLQQFLYAMEAWYRSLNLNSEQRRTLRLLYPWDNSPDLIYAIRSGKIKSKRISETILLGNIRELEELGYLRTYSDDVSEMRVQLNSEARQYAEHPALTDIHDFIRDKRPYFLAVFTAVLGFLLGKLS